MKEDAEAQDVLRCIGFQTKLSEPHQTMGDGRAEWYFKSEGEMRSLFPDYPELMANTLKIADMCNLTIHQYDTAELRTCLPHVHIPEPFKSEDEYVRHLVETGLRKRYKTITPEMTERAEHELSIIFKMGFSGYFLVVWEFINWSKKNNIPIGPGRGSGAGSLVAYAMEITDIDPFRFKLLFERFLNPERISMPDFDVDMDYDFRQEVIRHTREVYGDPQVGHIVTFGTLKAKAVIKDVGRVLGVPLAEVTALTKCIPNNPKFRLKDAFTPPDESHPENGQLIRFKDDPRYEKLFELCFKLENMNRNTSLHASGMVISLTPLPDWAPVFKDPKTGEVGVQYTMDIIEPCGLVKMDYLGLKTLDGELILRGRKKDTIVLRGGENTEPVPIEMKLQESPFIAQAVVLGQDQRFLGALIVADETEVKSYAAEQGILADSFEDLLAKPEIKKLFERQIASLINHENGFKLFERINRFALLAKPFEAGVELSAKQDIMRYKITSLYSNQIDSLFAD